MENNNIKISVVMATYNRKESLMVQLEAIWNQTYPKKLYEVIVVNDGSIDGTDKYLDEWANSEVNYKAIHQQNGGPAKARNTAVQEAKGEIIAFTDDDCIVDNNWLEVISKSFTKGIVGLQGATYTDRHLITPLTHQIDNETGHNSVPTCNAAYLRSKLLEIGGFDESFPNPHNEDTDVSWRMQQLGEIPFISEMRVHHPPRMDTFGKVAKRMKIMDCEFTLFKKNPKLYQKFRDKTPFKHIYVEIFFNTIGYYFLSRLKLWRRPKEMIQGLSLAIIWWGDLIRRLPRYFMLERTL